MTAMVKSFSWEGPVQIKTVRFVKSVVDRTGIPDDPFPQIAIAGRSNVGKSSLINALLQRKSLARTSSSPGRTRMINFFLVNESFYLVDLPGYGYASVDYKTRLSWGPLVHDYLDSSTRLQRVIMLLDIRRNVTRGDAQLLQWLAVNRKPVTLVLTKADKFKASKRANQVRQWQRELEAVGIRETPIVFSVSKKLGRDHLLEVMARSVEA